MQNAKRRPPVQDLGKTFPMHLCALPAADKNTMPSHDAVGLRSIKVQKQRPRHAPSEV